MLLPCIIHLKQQGKGQMCQQHKQLDGPVPKTPESSGRTPTDFKKALPEWPSEMLQRMLYILLYFLYGTEFRPFYTCW